MNTTFTVNDEHEIEVRGDGTLAPKSQHPVCQGGSGGNGRIGIQINVAKWDLSNPDEPVVFMKRLPHETVAGFTITRSQARAVASMLLSAAQEAH